MYRLAVCEDEEQVRGALCALCSEILGGWGVEHSVSAFSRADELESALSAGERFDLLCLDILMDGKTGIELAKQLRTYDEEVSLLFITGSSDFLKDGYAVRPIQYLFKPVERSELADALSTDLRLHHTPETVSIHTKTGVFSLPLRGLRYIESQDHMAVAYLPDGARFYRINLSELERLLPSRIFCRCHRGFLVNMRHISGMDRRGVLLDDGTLVPVGRSYYERVQERFVHYLNTT